MFSLFLAISKFSFLRLQVPPQTRVICFVVKGFHFPYFVCFEPFIKDTYTLYKMHRVFIRYRLRVYKTEISEIDKARRLSADCISTVILSILSRINCRNEMNNIEMQVSPKHLNPISLHLSTSLSFKRSFHSIYFTTFRRMNDSVIDSLNFY